jgi:CDP-diacylglycerol--serine O-phosphatidyltransferase
MSVKQNIPNFITLANLLCGCIGLWALFQEAYMTVFWCSFAAGCFDFLDGMAARLLKVSSEIGKELDSLADMVAFGVLPAFVLFHLLEQNGAGNLAFLGLVVAPASAMRLAKFNLDTRQTTDFIGVPTPANAAFVIGLLMVWHFDSLGFRAFLTTPVLVAVAIITAFLLNAPFKMLSFKMKTLSWKGNEARYSFLLISFFLFSLFGWAGFALSFIFYVLISLVYFKFYSK